MYWYLAYLDSHNHFKYTVVRSLTLESMCTVLEKLKDELNVILVKSVVQGSGQIRNRFFILGAICKVLINKVKAYNRYHGYTLTLIHTFTETQIDENHFFHFS